MSKLARFFGDIAKVDEQDDGTLIVTGYASSGTADSQGETVTPDAMAKALPDYMKFGNIREMHQPSAAGVTLKADVLEDGRTEIQAHIVDPTAVLKVKTGVYKGFSIGGQALKRDEVNKSEIQELRLTEISLVDRPANPEAVITMFKADDLPEQGDVTLTNEGDSTPTPEPEPLLTKADVAAMIAEALGNAAHPHDHAAGTEVQKTAQPEPPSAGTPPAGDTIQKGMGTVGSLANMLQGLSWLQQDTQWEKEWEGDNSEIPARLKALAAEMAGILKDMVTEETQELINSLSVDCPTCGADPCACPDPVAMAEQPTDLQKVDIEVACAIAKIDDIQKALDTMTGERDELRKALLDVTDKYEQILKMAQPTKAAVSAVAISKVEDNGGQTASEPNPTDTMAQMKKAHQAPKKIGLM